MSRFKEIFMTSRFTGIPFMAACALLLAPDAFAGLQGGGTGPDFCGSSPENPTVILGLLSVAAAGYPILRERSRRFFKRKDSALDQGATDQEVQS